MKGKNKHEEEKNRGKKQVRNEDAKTGTSRR
jgi:hypothetical protein